MIMGSIASLTLLLAADTATIVTADSASIAARDPEFRTEGGDLLLFYSDALGNRRSVKAADVVELNLGARRASPGAPPAADEVEVRLTTGDVLLGKLGPRPDEGLPLQSAVYGDLKVKFDHVRAILFPANRAFLPRRLPEKAVESDVVLTKSGDRAEGAILSVSNAGVTYKSRLLEVEMNLPLSDAAGVWLMEMPDPLREPGTLFAILLTSDGSSLRGEIESLKDGVLAFRDLYGNAHRVGAAQISSVYMKNGRVVYLSDIDPVEADEEANYIRGPEKSSSDLEYPFQRDCSAKGTPLLLGGVEHRKGLGVRAHSALTYPLGGLYRRFQATIGLDAASMGLGAVRAEAWVDGKKVKEIAFRGNDPPQPVDVDLSGAKELRLVVTWAGAGQSDFADWASARLIR
jgi:hypothetical protein